jgi:hypothetical protein
VIFSISSVHSHRLRTKATFARCTERDRPAASVSYHHLGCFFLKLRPGSMIDVFRLRPDVQTPHPRMRMLAPPQARQSCLGARRRRGHLFPRCFPSDAMQCKLDAGHLLLLTMCRIKPRICVTPAVPVTSHAWPAWMQCKENIC